MKINKTNIIGIIILLVLIWFGWSKLHGKNSALSSVKVIEVRRGNIATVVSTTGTVLPKNRLEVKAPVNGRIEQVMVKEGESVKAGQTIALMSSTERAALLDAARGQGDEKLKYWQEVYNPIPLTAPIDGEVIVGTIQPGQTVTTADPVIVLSDRLIVRAQVDETDIGKIKQGGQADLSLDAYPDSKIKASVDHIYYESKTVNNVTMYAVDLLPDNIPDFFRSGMNANIDFIQDSRENVLILPVNAVQKEHGRATVLFSSGNPQKPTPRSVETGLSDDKNIEIVSGLSEGDEVVIKSAKYSLPKGAGGGTNPLMPSRRNRK